MPITFNIYEAKTHFSRLLTQVEEGEEIIITKAGRPIAKIIPIHREPEPRPRQPGSAKGKLWIAPDFNEPLPAEHLKSFEEN